MSIAYGFLAGASTAASIVSVFRDDAFGAAFMAAMSCGLLVFAIKLRSIGR